MGEPGGDRQLGQTAPEGHAWDFGLTLTERAATERFRAEAWQVLAYVLTGSCGESGMKGEGKRRETS